MEKILVSACLLGLDCRYDGRSVPREDVIALGGKYCLVPVCPEIYGGLPTPRTPSERVGERVLMRDGTDVTDNYVRGALAAVRLCEMQGIKIAVLKAKSPSCGKGKIYDGSFSGILAERDGVTAEYLTRMGVKVLTEDEISELL